MAIAGGRVETVSPGGMPEAILPAALMDLDLIHRGTEVGPISVNGMIVAKMEMCRNGTVRV